MYDAALVGQCHVGACEDVIGNSLAEDFNTEDVGDYLLRLPLDIWMHKRHMIITANDIPQGR